MGTSGCVFTAPDHFELDGGVARPVADLTAPHGDVLDAAESCPAEAITVRDAAGALLAPSS
jgi:ferredoxin